MDASTALAALAIAVTILSGLFGYCMYRISRVEDSGKSTERDVAKLAQHVAENYVRGHEISEVKRAVEALRTDLQTQITTLRTELTSQVGDLVKAVNQMIGQHNK